MNQYKSGVQSCTINMQNQVNYQMKPAPSTATNMMPDETAQEAPASVKPKRIRTSFTSYQLNRLEQMFQEMQVITRRIRYTLSLELSLHEKQIKIWFQNRRMKKKKEKSKAVTGKVSQMPPAPKQIDPTPATIESHQVYNTEQGQCHINSLSVMMPSCQYEVAPGFSPAVSSDNSIYQRNTTGYQNYTSGYENKIQHQGTTSSSSFNRNSHLMVDQNFAHNKVNIPPSVAYKMKSPPFLDQNLKFYNVNQTPSCNPISSLNILPLTSTSSASSCNSNSPPSLDQNLGYLTNIIQVPSTQSLYNTNSPPIIVQGLSYQNMQIATPKNPSPELNQTALKATSSSSNHSNSTQTNSSVYQFVGIQGDNVSSDLIIPTFKTNICMEQVTSDQQAFPTGMDCHEIVKILADSH